MSSRSEMLYVRLTPEERKQIEDKMAQLGILNMSAYIRKMALDGYCIWLDLSAVREMTNQISRIGNNLNQVAKRVNETGSIYQEDIQDLQTRLDGIWKDCKEILTILASIR